MTPRSAKAEPRELSSVSRVTLRPMPARAKSFPLAAVTLLLLALPLPAQNEKPAAESKPTSESSFGGRTDLVSVKDLDVLPVLITGQPPQYPRALRKAGPTGYVVAEFIINREGDVVQIEVQDSSHREFEMSALVAIQSWKFHPGRKGNETVNVRMTERLEFAPPKK